MLERDVAPALSGSSVYDDPARWGERFDPEAVGLDVERLAEAYRNIQYPGERGTPVHGGWLQDAQTIAYEYARLTETKPESPA